MTRAELRYLQHFQQLSAIPRAIRYGIAALAEHEKEHRQKSTQNPAAADALAQIRDGILGIGETLRPEAIKSKIGIAEIEDTLQEFAESLAGPKHAGEPLLNLGLVMLCAEHDLFVSQLVHATLDAEPRLLLRLAPDKEVKLTEALKLADYHSLMERFRDDAAEEIARAGAEEKFTKHLGERLGLLEASEIAFSPLAAGRGAENSKDGSLEMLIELFEERRRIVHRGEFPVRDVKRLEQARVLFQSVATVLTINAVRKYAVRLESPASAALACACGKSLSRIPQPRLDEFTQKVREMFR